MKAALACVYFMAKEKIPHTTKYELSIEFCHTLVLFPTLKYLIKEANL